MIGLSSFKRITTSGNFIPEIDGLRFIAIVTVVLCHLCALLSAVHATTESSTLYHSVSDFLIRGRFGVQLFFVISGLVLGIPFCKSRMNREKSMHLKQYYFRRLTRIEPPYFLVMTGLLVTHLYITHTLDSVAGLKSLACSLLYIHNFEYGRHVYPLLTSVAWSLEIEIQFYLLVPLLSLLFLIRSHLKRRFLMIFISIFFVFLSLQAQFSFLSLYDYLQYFMIGFLLADFYNHKQDIKKNSWAPLIGGVSFLCIWLFDFDYFGGITAFFWQTAQLGFVFIFYYVVLFHNTFNWLKREQFTLIGGMCYSIYLLHYPLISLFGNMLSHVSVTGNISFDCFLFTLIILIIILFVSSIFFLLIERPCMKKDWYKGIFKMRSSRVQGISK